MFLVVACVVCVVLRVLFCVFGFGVCRLLVACCLVIGDGCLLFVVYVCCSLFVFVSLSSLFVVLVRWSLFVVCCFVVVLYVVWLLLLFVVCCLLVVAC